MAQFTDLPFRTYIVNTQSNVPNVALNLGTLDITVHETANKNSGANALMHAVFVEQGGGIDNVSFHFSVDSKEAIQILECWRIGYHAGDGCNDRNTDRGCFASVAIETCVNSDGDWEQTKRNLSKLLTMIVEGDERILGLRKGAFSYDRIFPHQRVSDDHKYCPRTMLDEGSLPTVIQYARELGDMSQPVQYAPPRPNLREMFGEKNHLSINGARVYRFRDYIQYQHPITPRQFAARNAPPIAADIPAHTTIRVIAFIAQANGDKWFLTNNDARLLMTEQTFKVM